MFVELHARSAFSFLEGAAQPEEMATVCAERGMSGMALADANGVYGSARFHLTAKKLGVRAYIGSEISLNSKSDSPQRHGDTEKRKSNGSVPLSLCGETRLPLLVASRAGYQNLCRLVTQMKLRVPKHAKPGECATSLEELENYRDGLICLTGGGEGPLAEALRRGGEAEGRLVLERLCATLGRENVYVELQRHFDREQEWRNQAAMRLAHSMGLPVIASNAPAYAHPAQRQLLDVFTCIRNHTSLSKAGKLLASNSERHIKDEAEMTRLFADVPQAIAETGALASRLEFTLADLGYEFPRYPLPEGETMTSFLRKRTEEGERERYGRKNVGLRARARRQIERELELIAKLKLEGYFLIVWDIVRFCREQGILVQGRGSAANSAVCYSLGITAVDPVGMDLLFERFLSEERGEWPDIDLDLPSGDQRERAIQYVYQRYGKLGAAMTANVITYRSRSAAREVGKALEFDQETLERVSKLVGHFEYRASDETLANYMQTAGCDLKHPRMQKYLELCEGIQDMPRHLGQHSGGMVICQGQLDSVVPLEPASMPGRVVVQWDKEDCADMGIIKVDLLGLGMMAVLEESLEIIRDDYGEEVDLSQIPDDDPVVYAVLQKADTVGMFQVESRAQMSCLPRLQPTRFYDVVIQVALIRPGPIVGQMVNPYIKRRQGRAPVEYAHPALEPILERTLGVPLFQEQLLRIAMVAAGFTGGEAEELRRALGSKRSEKRMREVEVKLREGMMRNGFTQQQQDEIVQSIVSFALYGFPESHAASFALIAYASAWLKTHYLGAFTAAILNNQPMGFYSPATLVKDAQRHGLKVLHADVAVSDWKCKLEQTPDIERQTSSKHELALRMGLRYVRGLRDEAAMALLQARKIRPFDSIADLARRVPELRRNELVTLADIGALNSLGKNKASGVRRQTLENANEELLNIRNFESGAAFHRRDALWQAEAAARPLGELLEEIPKPDGASPLQAMTVEERLMADYRGTGLTVGKHPMAYHREVLTQRGIRSALDLPAMANGRHVKVAGAVIVRQRPGTAHGFVFLSMEDETGIANIIVTPDLFQRYRVEITTERFLLVEGALQNIDGVVSVKAERITPLRVTELEVASRNFH
jgi:error-prone DNA polymerase